ncbi:MAG: type III-B CRISPR-associated protein Cas10/Cmr2, partial [Thermus sp.]|nr:type III-B CRISPR-associated protein Cas10/Cmr2 [Thermus sp.]
MNHLLAISLGPVQEFIATARRTRDLYAGSRLLSEAAAEVARFLGSRV